MDKRSISHVCRRLIQVGIYGVHGNLRRLPGGCLMRTYPKLPPEKQVAEVGELINELQQLVELWVSDHFGPVPLEEWLLDLHKLALKVIINDELHSVDYIWASPEDQQEHFRVVLES